MKIRIFGNSVRIRLSKTDVAHFCRTGLLEDKTDFGEQVFYYTLQCANDKGNLDAGFENGKITMYVPSNLVNGWDANQTVGFSHSKDLGEGRHLFLLLEKDFKCIDNTGMEDQSDNFENPSHTC